MNPLQQALSAIRNSKKTSKPSKYRARPAFVDGHRFDSQAESKRYSELAILQRAGEISSLQIHPIFSIDIGKRHVCHVELDFSYLEKGKLVYEDVKGHDNALSRLKRKLVEAMHNINVTVIR